MHFDLTMSSNPQHRFSATLEGGSRPGTWTYVVVPFSVPGTFGTRGQVKVQAWVNRVFLRGSLMPKGDGSHYMIVNKSVREQAGVERGDTVTVVLGRDEAPRTVEVPEALRVALQADPAAQQFFKRLSYSHQKEYTDWLASAKRKETRLRRAAKAVVMLTEGKRLK